MGILDSVIGSVLGGTANSPMGTILGQILGGRTAQPTSAGPETGAGGGLLGGLLDTLRQAGLGPQVDSWVGSGPNHPVSPGQLQDAFGQGQVNSWAEQAGMPSHDFLSQLSQHLPSAVNQMTPNGRLPDEGTASV